MLMRCKNHDYMYYNEAWTDEKTGLMRPIMYVIIAGRNWRLIGRKGSILPVRIVVRK